MTYSNGSGGTLTLPSPTHAHHVDMTAAVRSLRRSLSRSPSKFNLSGASAGSGTTTPTAPAASARDGSVAAATPQVAFEGGLAGQTTTSSRDPLFDGAGGPAGAATTPAAWPERGATTSSGRFFENLTSSKVLNPSNFFSPQTSSTSTSTPLRSSLKLSVRSARPKGIVTRPLSRTRVSPKSPLKRVFGASSDSGNAPPATISSPKGQGQENFNEFALALALSPTSRRNLEKPSRHSMHLDVSGSSKYGISRLLDLNGDFPSNTVSPLKRSDAIMNLDQASLGSPVAKRRSLHGISSLGSDFNIFDHPPASTQSSEAQEEMNQEYQLSGSTAPAFREPIPSPTPAMTRRSTSLRKSTLQQRHDGTPNRSSWGRRAGEKQLAQFTNQEASTPNSRFRPRLSLDQYVPLEPERASPFTPGPLPNPSAHPMTRTTHQPHPLSRAITQSSSSAASLQDDTPTHVPVQFGEKPRAPLNFAKSLPAGATRPPNPLDPAVATPAYKHAKPYQGAFMSTGLVSKMNRNPEQGPPNSNKFPSSKPAFVMPDTPCKKQSYPSATYPPHPGSGRRSSRPSFGSPTTPFGSVTKRNGDITGDLLFRPNAVSHGRKSSVFSVDGLEDADAQEMPPPTPTKNLFRKSVMAGQAKKGTSPLSVGFDKKDSSSPSCDPDIASPLEHVSNEDSLFPQTPQESMAPPDASRLFISNHPDTKKPITKTDRRPSFPPATPTMEGREVFLALGGADRRLSMTPNNRQSPADVDEDLLKFFDKADIIGTGEFSTVYRVSEKPSPTRSATFNGFSTPSWRSPRSPVQTAVYAVKKIRLPPNSARLRRARWQEVEILNDLRHSDKVVRFIRSWDNYDFLYIMTEFCEEGSLEQFLKRAGNCGRIDDFRIWKILIEACEGLMAIHAANIIHLDIKPANILINREGYLKIADFGMATRWPAAKGIEGEGDREYIGPEILSGHFDKPADIFSLGLIILEMACNVFLPDNGPAWQALRSGDLSAVGPLTSPQWVYVSRDPTGTPIPSDPKTSPLFEDENVPVGMNSEDDAQRGFPFELIEKTHNASNLFGTRESNPFANASDPPKWMLDALHVNSLDGIVRWMLKPNPANRPSAADLLKEAPLMWVSNRRLAGAAVYEGNWGSLGHQVYKPKAAISAGSLVQHDMDTEMTDV
ncbi:kinase-like protein [Thozetella sp. PMI_491]|nr:kinase-like protein [Thozetella sp. PMI_491]